MKLRHHYILFGTTLLLSVACAVAMLFVNVNSDMTKYLPKKSQMKQGLTIINEEFGNADINTPGIKVMFSELSDSEKAAMKDSLNALPDVNKLQAETSEDGQHTLYSLYVDDSVDQKSLGKQIKRNLPKVEVVETSQDGATPPVSVMVIAAVLIIAILLFMCQSWVEPFIYLATTGLAILLNMGTNALLPSVSITTHSIAAILQLVLSIDYCIIMTNRYRQKKKTHPVPVEAANLAMQSAFPPVMSSAMTTVVGLLMLCFMRLRIGMDMGVVLAKGVICSLICTFTILPSLLMMLEKAIEKSHKKTFVIPTDRLGRFATSHKIPIAIFAVVLFGVAFFFSQRTTIFFSAEAESRIEKVFPKTNPFVVIYHTADEDSIIQLADSFQGRPHVISVVSYPTLLQHSYTADEMARSLRTMASEFGDYMDFGDQIDLLTPELVRVLYYMRTGEGDSLAIGFPELTRFIQSDCLDNPLFADMIDDEMRRQMETLNQLTTETAQPAAEPKKAAKKQEPAFEPIEEPVAEDTVPAEPDWAMDAPADKVETPIQSVELDSSDKPVAAKPTVAAQATYPIVSFINKLYTAQPSALTMDFRTLADTITMRRVMNAQEMSEYIGSSLTQTRLVFNYDTKHRKAMTPLEYMHILTDDLFNRKALNGMISVEQKATVRTRTNIMDLCNRNAKLTAQQLASAATRFGISGITAGYVEELMYVAPVVKEPKPALKDTTAQQQKLTDTTVVQTAPVLSPLIASFDSIVTAKVQSVPEPVEEEPAPVVRRPKRRQTAAEREADRKAALFLDLMYGGKTYTAAEMAGNFSQLGQPVDTAMISLLYTYYGSIKCYDDSLQMTIEEVLRYVSGPLLDDPRLAQLLDEPTRESIGGIDDQLKQGVGMLRGEEHSLLVVLTDLPDESDSTYLFVDYLDRNAEQCLPSGYNTIGESVMYSEMKKGFNHEMMIVTILTILAIFLIVAITFRSVVVPTILVLTVMTAVYVNVVFCGIVSGEMLYLAYLIVQSILMGATIDYGILFANYYREKRKTLPANEAIFESYHGSIRTIMTSGLIMVVAPAAMAILTDNVMISNIVGCLAIGAFVAIVLILVVLPGVLVVFDRWVVHNAVPKRGSVEQIETETPAEEKK